MRPRFFEARSERWVYAAACLVVVAIFFAWGHGEREPVASAETRFVEYSETGLQIVPASCASVPLFEHAVGECSVDVCPSMPGIQASGPCSDSGSTDLCPYDAGTQTNRPCPSCPDQTNWDYGACYVAQISQGKSLLQATEWCNEGAYRCGYPSCPLGYALQGNECVFVGCPTGYAFSATTGSCVQSPSQCIPLPMCGSGANANKVVNSCNGSVVDDCTARGMNWFCFGGQCFIVPPQGGRSGDISVRPGRVRSGERTEVTWTSQGFSACQITENNPAVSDAWTGLTGDRQSSPIAQRTTYSLRCDGVIVDTATVNILPVFIEK